MARWHRVPIVKQSCRWAANWASLAKRCWGRLPSRSIEFVAWSVLTHTEDRLLGAEMERLSRKMEEVGLTQDYSREVIQGFGYDCAWATHWTESGRPIIRLSRALAAALALTEAPGVPCAEVKLPFPALLLEIYSTPFSVKSSIDGFPIEDLTLPVDVVLVHEFYGERGQDGIADPGAGRRIHSLVGVDYDRFLEVLAPPPNVHCGREWRLTSISSQAGHCVPGTDDIPLELAWRTPLIDENASLEGWLERGHENLHLHAKNHHIRLLSSLHRVVANLALYLQTRVGRLQPLPKRKKKKKGKRGHPEPTIYQVGSEIRLPAAVSQSVGDATHNPMLKLRRRFVVRGHWRNQAHGPGRQLRKRIWIQPFWKGPDTAEELERIYKAETLEEAGLTDA